jgi:hypothetical protein
MRSSCAGEFGRVAAHHTNVRGVEFIERLRPSVRHVAYLNLPDPTRINSQHETVCQLPIGVILGKYDYMRPFSVGTHGS